MDHLAMVQEAKVVVGLDFGTTFSGFAYALRGDPEKIYTFYDWPMQASSGTLPYCKTQTSLWYVARRPENTSGSLELRDWGWPAFVNYKSASSSSTSDTDIRVSNSMNMLAIGGTWSAGNSSGACSKTTPRGVPSESGYFLTLFKLHLAEPTATHTISISALPPGVTAQRAISDYLSKISEFVLKEVQNKFGGHIAMEDIQWCLTVPAIWDDNAKDEMKTCAEIAGMVQGPRCKKEARSPHPVKILIEPEAASVYCQLQVKDYQWTKGDQFLVVDCGGGTVDLVLHEKLGSASTLTVREVQESSGGMFGGSFVDKEFVSFLRRKISCFERFEKEHPATLVDFYQKWQSIKYAFDGEKGVMDLELPPKLASMWEEQHSAPRMMLFSGIVIGSYDEVELTDCDMRSIFDPVVDRILELIEGRMVAGLKAVVVVGGFSASPYLMRRIRETFASRVTAIVSPPNPGSAVCCGAVTMGIRSGIVTSRISKKTYGIRMARSFMSGIDSETSKTEGDPGCFFCKTVFDIFVRKGDEVSVDDSVTRSYSPISRTQTKIEIDLYSTSSTNPVYVTDSGAKKEGTFTIDIPSHAALGFRPKIIVSVFFGRSQIQVTAVGKNFVGEKKDMLPVKFERESFF